MNTKRILARDAFFDFMRSQWTALTFDDVLVGVRYADAAPGLAKVNTMFSKRIPLLIPIVSAAMDTVTEALMAIAMARAGGLGVVHKGKAFAKNLEAYAAEIAKVKRELNIRIDAPVTVNENDTIETILKMLEGKNFRSVPVLDNDGKLSGLLTNRHFELCEDTSTKAQAVMTPREKMVVGTAETTVQEAARLMRESDKGVLPLTNAENILVGMYVSSDIKRATQGSGTCNLDKQGHLLVGAAIGAGDIMFELERAKAADKAGADFFSIDASHGESRNVFTMIEHLKSNYPHRDVIAGNIVSAEAARNFADRKVDGIKVGIGGGSICNTREVGGAGRPQISAVEWVTRELRDEGIPVCSDGGIRFSGDIVKAIAAGASSVMLGKMLAGATESPGKLLEGGLLKEYRGMGSKDAMREGSAEERYNQAATASGKRVAEGVTGTVPFLGPVAGVLDEIVGGIMVGMGLAGAGTIEQLMETGNFDRITMAGVIESHPHDIGALPGTR